MSAAKQLGWIGLVAALGLGCSNGGAWNPWAGRGSDSGWQSSTAPGQNPSAAPGQSATPGIPKPPPGAGEATTFTILLRIFDDPLSHVEDSDYYQKTLTERLGWKNVFVVHQGGRSELFWGRYRTVAEAQPNLKAAKAHRAQTGESPFPLVMVVPMPGEDIGPAEWNLKNCKGAYSLLVAVFQDDLKQKYVGRKRFAVDYCKRLREHGYEAYFHHGGVASSVTIGAFPASAVSIRPAPEGEQVTYKDPKIEALQRDFPLVQINGLEVYDITRDARGNEIRSPRHTYVIRVPRLEGAYAP